jgi:hypothetical protein
MGVLVGVSMLRRNHLYDNRLLLPQTLQMLREDRGVGRVGAVSAWTQMTKQAYGACSDGIMSSQTLCTGHMQQ